jgi:hypothetical protein
MAGLTVNQETVILTDEILEKGRSANGGYSRRQLELFGIVGFPSGWKKALVGQSASVEVVERYLMLKDKHLTEKRLRKPSLPSFPRPLKIQSCVMAFTVISF